MDVLSIPSYDFVAPPRIVFGWGRWREIGPLAGQLGRRAFLVLGSRTLAANGFLTELCDVLRQCQVEPIELATISHEPEVADVDRAAEAIRVLRPAAGDLLIGIGGGSAIDLAKALAALATNTAGSSVKDYLEGVGRGLKLSEPPLPMIALPTTAGTGSEATKNAVISSYDPPFKKSLRADAMMPRAVVVDPQLTVSVPPTITAWTGMDAITQLIESYLSRKARPIPQALAAAGLRIALPALVEAVEDGTSRAAREAMSQAALWSGLALANSGLGMAHGVAAALGVHVRAAHGLACALMLPVALKVNRPVCEPQMAQLAREAGLTLAPSDSAAADTLIDRVETVCQRVGVPRRLSELGVSQGQIAELVRDSRGNSMDGNPRALSDAELAEILEGAVVIVAAGLTPAWQQILRFERFEVGEVNRARDVHWCASGKVLNVAVALAHLGAASETVALAGGPPVELMDRELTSLGIHVRWVAAHWATRVCTTILDLESGHTTELVENAGPVTAAELESFFAEYARRIEGAGVAVLTGSLPRGTPASFYSALLAATDCRAILDFRGEELFQALERRPFLVKPNREELAGSLRRPLDTEQQIKEALGELNDRGAEWAVVTDGPRAVLASSRGRCYRLEPPSVDVVNPIGSGDCLAAGIAWGLDQGSEPLEAIRIGIAAAVENVSQLLPARIDPARVVDRARSIEFHSV